MQRPAGVVGDVVEGEREPLVNQDREMIEVEKNTSQPKKPEVSQCSSTGRK